MVGKRGNELRESLLKGRLGGQLIFEIWWNEFDGKGTEYCGWDQWVREAREANIVVLYNGHRDTDNICPSN